MPSICFYSTFCQINMRKARKKDRILKFPHFLRDKWNLQLFVPKYARCPHRFYSQCSKKEYWKMYRAERPASREPRRGERTARGGCEDAGVVEEEGRGAARGRTGAHGWHTGGTGGRTGHSLRLYRILVKCEIFYGHSSKR